jgi:C-terminal processing protease CtpA/Prc
VPSFLGSGWANEMDAAIAALAGATRMIVDVRDNGGGNQPLAVDIAGRFADRASQVPEGVGVSQPAPGVRLLALPRRRSRLPARRNSRGQFICSQTANPPAALGISCERCTLPNVTVVGDTTAGGWRTDCSRLANGWTYQVSSWIEYGLDRTPIEGVGLAPDVLVAPQPTRSSTWIRRSSARWLAKAGS